MTQRQIQVGRSIQQALSELLLRGAVKDPRIAAAGLISVTEVRMSPDMRHARVYVSVYPGEPAPTPPGRRAPVDPADAAIKGLRRAASFLRGEVGRALGTKFWPELDFVRDETMERAAHIEGILREVAPAQGNEPPDDDSQT